METKVKCDRCGKQVFGLKADNFTAGFYLVELGSAWCEYRREGENIICDECMWKDSKYVRDYPGYVEP